jgi:hypothetical protein
MRVLSEVELSLPFTSLDHFGKIDVHENYSFRKVKGALGPQLYKVMT